MRSLIFGRSHVSRSVLIAVALSFAASSAPLVAQENPSAAECRPAGPLVRVPGLMEASGLAASRRVPGRLWTHNDSGQPVVFALDAQGAVTGQVRVTGATVEDWEAIAVGPCGTGSCLYIGDIGDNDAERQRITVYRVPEPDATGGTAAVADVLHATYPDGPQNAEALLVAGDGRLYIVTLGETGPTALYRFPTPLVPGAAMTLEHVGSSSKPDAASRITDGAISPDGQWAVLRTRSTLSFYRAANLLAGQWSAATTVDVTALGEPQGEGVALGADNTVFLAGEGGGMKRPGTFARFSCAPRG